MTFFIATMDYDTMTLRYANAGHCSPWHVRKSTEIGPPKAKLLLGAGPRLGEKPEIHDIEEKSISIESGDMLVFYTDGLFEGKNLKGEMYGKKRARKVIESNYSKGESAVMTTLVKDFMAFNGNKSLDDDLTLVIASILK
jgi:sigma-B regulation protein RsbU (phosphoserine phosphatase)